MNFTSIISATFGLTFSHNCRIFSQTSNQSSQEPKLETSIPFQPDQANSFYASVTLKPCHLETNTLLPLPLPLHWQSCYSNLHQRDEVRRLKDHQHLWQRQQNFRHRQQAASDSTIIVRHHHGHCFWPQGPWHEGPADETQKTCLTSDQPRFTEYFHVGPFWQLDTLVVCLYKCISTSFLTFQKLGSVIGSLILLCYVMLRTALTRDSCFLASLPIYVVSTLLFISIQLISTITSLLMLYFVGPALQPLHLGQ